MKKNWIKLFSTILFFSLVLSTNAKAGEWSEEYIINVPGHSSYTVYFIPGVAGEHEITWSGEWSAYYTGNMESYWGSSNNPGNWTWFAENYVLSTVQDKELDSGSSDIIYKFVYWNTTDNTHQFIYLFWTDN